MRNRANASPIPTPPEPSPIPPYVPPKRTKYDDLVDMLADGLFEMVLERRRAGSDPQGQEAAGLRRQGAPR